MKTIPVIILMALCVLTPSSFAKAAVHGSKPRTHLRVSPKRLRDSSVDRASASRPFVTIQPADLGTGALAPNGYRGPGSATGGPAGGLSTGGP